MSKWMNEIDLADLQKHCDEGTLSAYEIGKQIAARLRKVIKRLKFPRNYQQRQEIRAADYGLCAVNEAIKPGDLYLAKKNTGPHLLTCRENNGSFIVPEEKNVYWFNVCDCVKIVDM